MKVALLLSLAFVLTTACGTGDDGGSGDGTCPQVATSYVITQHCSSEMVGEVVDFDLNGCRYTVVQWDMSGTVSSNGQTTVSGAPDSDEVIRCSGPISSTSFSVDCNNDCHVEGNAAD